MRSEDPQGKLITWARQCRRVPREVLYYHPAVREEGTVGTIAARSD